MNFPRLNSRDKIRIGNQIYGPMRSLDDFEDILRELGQAKRRLRYALGFIAALLLTLVIGPEGGGR